VSETVEPGSQEPPSEETAPSPGATGSLRAIRAIDPAKLLRIASVTREVLEEARRIRPEPGAVEHLRRVHDQIDRELREALPADLF